MSSTATRGNGDGRFAGSGSAGDVVTISVVVVNWNARDDLRDCLEGLRRQTDREYETVVVDNGSTDGSLDMLRAEFPEVVAVDALGNLGFAEGCNRGIDRATGTWIALLNNDAVASPDWIAALRQAARAGGPSLGMIQSRILFKHDPKIINSTGVLIYRDSLFVDRSYQEPISPDEAAQEIFCVSAGAALYRRAMLDDVRLESGMFDREFFMYFEDVDLGWRARLAGWSALYEPRATVLHAFHGSAGRHGQNFVRLQCGKNRLRTVLKNGSLPYVVRSWRRIFYDLVWSLGEQGPRAIGEYLAAGLSGVRQRRAVSRIAGKARREIELDWVADGGRLAAPREGARLPAQGRSERSVKRIGLYAHYDAKGQVKAYVVHHLRALREVCDAVWFISSAELPEAELAKARALCERVWTRENVGFDFGMWKDSIGRLEPDAWDELVLTNSSVFGPLWPLAESFAKMDPAPCDLWGMTDNVDVEWHLQSYFLVFRSRILKSEAFPRFWETVNSLTDKEAVIHTYECRLARFFREAGFDVRALVPQETLGKPLLWRFRNPSWRNSTLSQPSALLRRRMPYVKLQLLRENPAHVRLASIYKAMGRAGYDLGLIEIDPRPETPRGEAPSPRQQTSDESR